MWRAVIDLMGGGFHPKFQQHEVYEFRRFGGHKTAVYRMSDQPEYFNVANLEWREPPSARILAELRGEG